MSRKDRVEHAMRDELAQLIAREIKDPRVSAAGVVGVARVECTADFSVAKVYVSIFADDAVASRAMAGLEAAAGFLRGPLGRRLHLGRPPELRFVHDRSSEMSLRLTEVLREDADKAAAAGRADEVPPPGPVRKTPVPVVTDDDADDDAAADRDDAPPA